jgi:hypothetical protein
MKNTTWPNSSTRTSSSIGCYPYSFRPLFLVLLVSITLPDIITGASCVDEPSWTTVDPGGVFSGASCDTISQKPTILCDFFSPYPKDGKETYDACCACSEYKPSASPSSSPSTSPSSSPSVCYDDPSWFFDSSKGYGCEELLECDELCDVFKNDWSSNGKNSYTACCLCGGGVHTIGSLHPTPVLSVPTSSPVSPTENQYPSELPSTTSSEPSCSTCVSSTEAPTVCPNFGIQTPLESSSITLGDGFTCAITDGGLTLKCWGDNSSGQLGDGTFVDKNTPTLVSLGTTFPQATQIVAGRDHMCAIDNGDNLKCWGSNFNGKVRNRSTFGTSSVNSPFLVLSDVTQVSPATTLTCMIDKSNNFYGLGETSFGQFGDGTSSSNYDDPTIIIPGTSSSYATQITSGVVHTCMIDSCNVLKCMGSNSVGQLGIETNGFYRGVPTTVIDSTASYYITQVSAGWNHSCAIDNTNNLYCWGFNGSGQLGDGTTNFYSNLPILVTLVPGGAPFLVTQVSAGLSHTCAIDITNNLYCWGGNSFGQLGDSTTVSKNLPTLITISTSSPPTAFTQIGTGQYHTCAIDNVNDLYCWGKNLKGQIGNGTAGGNVLSPTKILTV